MTREERLKICKACTNRRLDMKIGLVCSLTGEMATFETDCPDFSRDVKEASLQNQKKIEKESAEKGRKKTMNVFYALLGLSISLMFFSHLTFKPVNGPEIIKEIIRLCLSIGLYYAIYIGKNWAKKLFTILCILGMLIGLISMFLLVRESPAALIMVVLVGIYGYAVHFFNYDRDFLAFFEYQKSNN